jgi:hypothetical protein
MVRCHLKNIVKDLSLHGKTVCFTLIKLQLKHLALSVSMYQLNYQGVQNVNSC